MSKRDPNILLEDVAIAIKKIGLFTAGMDRQTFLGDAKTIDAVARNLEIIGEAVRQLSDDFKNAHPDIPWNQIGGMRNRIVHEYFRLDVEIVWQVIHKDLPDLETRLRLLT
jgi:uncharacterized protein with HEPN domain